MTLKVAKPLAKVTAKMHVKKTKKIVEQCVNDELIDKNPLKGFKCGGGNKDVIPLEMEKVQRILNKKLTIDRLAEVRDAFIFPCFTGFAFQDIYGLTQENIITVDIKGDRWLPCQRASSITAAAG